MNFCTECGKALKENPMFCTECGTPQEQQNSQATAEVRGVQKRPLSRKKKIGLMAGGIGIACLVIAHFIITSITDPVNKVQAMDRAISEENTEAFFKEITLDETALINEEQYLEYIKETGWEEMRSQFAEIAGSTDTFDTTVWDERGNTVFIVKKTAFIPGLYHTYEFDAIPNELVVKSNIHHATITIDKQSAEVNDSEEGQPFATAYPGKFDIVGKASSPFGDYSYKDTVNVRTRNDKVVYFPLEFDISYRSYYTNIPEATLFIDGESTKKTLSDFDELGPFPGDRDVVVHAEWKDDNGKTHKTDEVTQNDVFWGGLNLEFDIEEDAVVASTTDKVEELEANSESAEDHVLNFREAYEQALNARDYSLVSPFLLSKSPADKELKKYIGDLQDKGYSYEFTENTVTASEDLGEGMFLVSTNEIFIFTNHLNEQIHYDREKTYYLSKKDEGFRITEIVIKDTDRNDL